MQLQRRKDSSPNQLLDCKLHVVVRPAQRSLRLCSAKTHRRELRDCVLGGGRNRHGPGSVGASAEPCSSQPSSSSCASSSCRSSCSSCSSYATATATATATAATAPSAAKAKAKLLRPAEKRVSEPLAAAIPTAAATAAAAAAAAATTTAASARAGWRRPVRRARREHWAKDAPREVAHGARDGRSGQGPEQAGRVDDAKDGAGLRVERRRACES